MPLCVLTGGFCSSTRVDKLWESLFRSKVSPQAHDVWQAQYPLEVLQMQAEWEAVKSGFDSSSSLSRFLARIKISSGTQCAKTLKP